MAFLKPYGKRRYGKRKNLYKTNITRRTDEDEQTRMMQRRAFIFPFDYALPVTLPAARSRDFGLGIGGLTAGCTKAEVQPAARAARTAWK